MDTEDLKRIAKDNDLPHDFLNDVLSVVYDESDELEF